MNKNVHARSHAEEATLEDVEAMLAAARGDSKVKSKLGDGYLATVAKAVAQARELAGGGAPTRLRSLPRAST